MTETCDEVNLSLCKIMNIEVTSTEYSNSIPVSSTTNKMTDIDGGTVHTLDISETDCVNSVDVYTLLDSENNTYIEGLKFSTREGNQIATSASTNTGTRNFRHFGNKCLTGILASTSTYDYMQKIPLRDPELSSDNGST